jgi:hypothetical protein
MHYMFNLLNYPKKLDGNTSKKEDAKDTGCSRQQICALVVCCTWSSAAKLEMDFLFIGLYSSACVHLSPSSLKPCPIPPFLTILRLLACFFLLGKPPIYARLTYSNVELNWYFLLSLSLLTHNERERERERERETPCFTQWAPGGPWAFYPMENVKSQRSVYVVFHVGEIERV